MKSDKLRIVVIASASLAVVVTLFYLLVPGVTAFAVAAEHMPEIDPGVLKWGYMAAALTTGLATIASAFAVASVGAAAVGAMAEKPELFGRTLVLVGLAEGIAIYGLIVSVMILNRLG